eukprot:scaffold61038_cov18-Tisochrysis_lutea.AAC.1
MEEEDQKEGTCKNEACMLQLPQTACACIPTNTHMTNSLPLFALPMVPLLLRLRPVLCGASRQGVPWSHRLQGFHEEKDVSQKRSTPRQGVMASYKGYKCYKG